MRRTTGLIVVVLVFLTSVASAVDLPGEPVWYADLDRETMAALERLAASGEPFPEDAGAILKAILESCVPFRFEHDRFTAYTDRRWYESRGPEGAGLPLMVLRRWPGDTVLALYGLGGNRCTPADGAPAVAGGSFRPAGSGPQDQPACVWDGVINSEMGEHPARWVERPVPDRPCRLGALMLLGDAGLGADALPGLMMELQGVLGHTVLHGDQWPEECIADITEAVPPALVAPPGDRSEAEDPWQIALAWSFTIGLPPGLRAMRTDAGPGADLAVPGGLLWIRGRFTDRTGDLVVVGDPHRAGYVAGLEGDADWPLSSRLPAGLLQGERIAVQEFEVVRDRTGAAAATAARWKEPGFDGEWLVYRLLWPETAIEIGLPVLSGRQSEALFWIPATFRVAGRPPAPPPLDPAERFGISFERLTGAYRKENPWMEGYLSVPGFRIEVPLGWYPVNSLRTRDGFPVVFYDGDGELRGLLERVEESFFESLDQAASGWEPINRPGRFRAQAAWRNGDGAGLFRSRTGGGFRLQPVGDPAGESWERMLGSVQMLRPGR